MFFFIQQLVTENREHNSSLVIPIAGRDICSIQDSLTKVLATEEVQR